ncbi:MAG: hypothetical protein WCN88_05210 [Candidatus Falkowbacteria bacterium]
MNFFARNKKIFLILGFFALVFVIGYLIWRFFFQTTISTPIATSTPGIINGLPSAGLDDGTGIGQTGGQGGLPTTDGQGNVFTPGKGAPSTNEPNPVAAGGITKTEIVNQSPSLDPTLNSDGSIQYYDKNKEKFYKIDSDGNKVLLSDKAFHSVENVTWAPDKDKAVLEYPDGSKILYNFTTKKQVTLPAHWKDFSFSPDSTQIISKSMGIDSDNRWLVVSNDDGSKAKAVEAIGTNDKTIYPSWSPNNQIVAMYTEGVDFDRQEVFFIGQNGENFKSTIVEGRGFDPKWSTTGDRLLYSVYNTTDNLKPRLWIVDAGSDTISQNRRSIDIETWASKCTFASNTEVYCAVPDNLENGAGLFPELADKTKDSLYKIDLTTGSQKLIAVPDGSFNISQIIIGSDQDYLYFTDKFSGSIYKVKL